MAGMQCKSGAPFDKLRANVFCGLHQLICGPNDQGLARAKPDLPRARRRAGTTRFKQLPFAPRCIGVGKQSLARCAHCRSGGGVAIHDRQRGTRSNHGEPSKPSWKIVSLELVTVMFTRVCSSRCTGSLVSRQAFAA